MADKKKTDPRDEVGGSFDLSGVAGLSGDASADPAWKCPNCQTENDSALSSCSHCGRAKSAPKQQPVATGGFPWKKILIGVVVAIVVIGFIVLVGWGVSKGINALFPRTPSAQIEKAATPTPAATKAPTVKPLPSVVAVPGQHVTVKSPAKGCKALDFTVPSAEGTYTIGDGGDGTCAVTVKVTFEVTE